MVETITSPHTAEWSRAPIPARAGVGLKPDHIDAIVSGRPDVGWFEIHPENYMGAGGAPHHYLTKIREAYPISFHGVGLSIGAAQDVDRHHLARLKALMDRYEPAVFSEHLAWSTHEAAFLSDLLPLPYTEETLAVVCRHVDQVQDFLGRRMLLENPSTYVMFADSAIPETAFLAAIAQRTGCGLLLDVNNVQVSAINHGYDPARYIDEFAMEHVGEFHLGGHAEFMDSDGGPLLIDAHDREVADPVWDLYARAISRAGATPTLIEWDNDVPRWETLAAEARRADAIIAARGSNHD